MILVFVLDGLRPDALNPIDSPTLFRLRQEGVNYLNSHAVFPTVTRVNAAAIATGTYPGTNGIVSNFMAAYCHFLIRPYPGGLRATQTRFRSVPQGVAPVRRRGQGSGGD